MKKARKSRLTTVDTGDITGKQRVMLAINIEPEAWEATKAQAASEHKRLREWAEEAIQEKLERASKAS